MKNINIKSKSHLEISQRKAKSNIFDEILGTNLSFKKKKENFTKKLELQSTFWLKFLFLFIFCNLLTKIIYFFIILSKINNNNNNQKKSKILGTLIVGLIIFLTLLLIFYKILTSMKKKKKIINNLFCLFLNKFLIIIYLEIYQLQINRLEENSFWICYQFQILDFIFNLNMTNTLFSLISWIISFIYYFYRFQSLYKDPTFLVDILLLLIFLLIVDFCLKRNKGNFELDFLNNLNLTKFYKNFMEMLPDGLLTLAGELSSIKFANNNAFELLNVDNIEEIKTKFQEIKNVLSEKNNMEESAKLRSRILSEKTIKIQSNFDKIHNIDNGLKILNEKIEEEENKGNPSIYLNRNYKSFKSDSRDSVFKQYLSKRRTSTVQLTYSNYFDNEKYNLGKTGNKLNDEQKKKILLNINKKRKIESIKKIFLEKCIKNKNIDNEIVNNFMISNHRNLLNLLKFIFKLIESAKKEVKIEEENSVFDIGFIMAYELNPETTSRRIIEIRLIPAIFKGTPNIMMVLRDKTYADTIYELKKNDEKKDIHMASVTHELRTPLNGIIAMLEILGDKINDYNLFNQYLDPALKSSKLLLNLINDILDRTQIKEGKFRLVCINFKLEEVLSSAFDIISIQAKNRGLNLFLKLDDNLKNINWVSDPHRLRQIVINLLGIYVIICYSFD